MKITSRTNIDFRKRNLVFIDLEFTGLDPNVHEILEIGCVLVDPDLQVIKTFETKTIPEHSETADPASLVMNGYSEEKWKNAVPLKNALEELNQLAKDAMFAGWNISSDWLFLDKGFQRFEINPIFDYHFIDAMSIAYVKFLHTDKPESLRLRNMAEYYGIEMGETHGALEDATATYKIFKKLMEK